MPTAPVICITTMISFLYSRIETGTDQKTADLENLSAGVEMVDGFRSTPAEYVLEIPLFSDVQSLKLVI